MVPLHLYTYYSGRMITISENKAMKLLISTFFTLLLIGFASSGANGQDADFTADTFIRSVIAGQDFEGQDIILSGYVLDGNSSGSGLINLGTLETYQSSSYENFISIYESPISLPEGMPAVFRVKIRSSSAMSIGGTSLVIIETVFSECLSC
jgi:hypothetical protein